MKLTFRTLAFSLCLLSTSSQAQKFYANLHAGYHFAVGGSLDDYYNATASSLSVTYTHKKMSHGTSLQSGLSIGYQLMKNIGIELGFSKAFQNQVVFKRSIKPAWQGYYFDEFIRSYSSYFITPAIVVRSGYEKVNVYSKFGLVVLKGKSNTVYKENNNGFLSEIDYETKGISGLGLHGALGASIRLHKSVDLQLEINTSNVSGSPKSQTITRRIEDGEDLLPEMTVSEKETEYVKEFTITQSDPDPTQPAKRLKVYIPYNNIGFRLGFVYKF